MITKDADGKPLVLTLSQWRKLRGHTQEKLAELSGVSAKTIGNYEKNYEKIKNARYATVMKIAEALEIGTDNIFFG